MVIVIPNYYSIRIGLLCIDKKTVKLNTSAYSSSLRFLLDRNTRFPSAAVPVFVFGV